MMTRLNDFFEEGSPFLNHPLLTAERTAVETNFIVAQLQLPAGARILDVGCAFGRHSIALAQRGYTVTGIDPAAAMIAAAREQAKEAGVSVDFRQARGEQFTTDTPFDAAICLFTSLGQMGPDGDNSGLVSRVYDALKPGGRFVVEVPQRNTAVAQLRPSDKFGEGERYAAVTRQYNPADQTVTETFRLIAPEETRTYTLRYRLYSRAALETLLTQSGFTIQAAYSDYAETPLTDESATMILIGEKKT
jgi:2-polyprenyl-3-methyl-5-hydroxy-6-metoxy-1,4-benzoquinol methylase